jgi:hypothetical protein
MCPVCLATAAIVASGVSGTGGLTALIAHRFRRRKTRNPDRLRSPEPLDSTSQPARTNRWIPAFLRSAGKAQRPPSS